MGRKHHIVALAYGASTINEDLSNETDYLRRYDIFRAGIDATIDMPDQTIDLLFPMLRQDGGWLFLRARQNEFAQLNPDEVGKVEQIYVQAFERHAAQIRSAV